VGYFTTEISEPSDIDDSYFQQLSEEKKLRQSIIENLTMILQTRRGSVLHLSDFGIPDIVQVYIDSGYSFEQLKKYISETILKYEPRVSKVKVEETKFDKDNFHIFLKIKAIIKDLAGTEILLTEFSTTGWTKVVSEKEK
jgi:type VI secretion system protein